jgi:hypothetical protein
VLQQGAVALLFYTEAKCFIQIVVVNNRRRNAVEVIRFVTRPPSVRQQCVLNEWPRYWLGYGNVMEAEVGIGPTRSADHISHFHNPPCCLVSTHVYTHPPRNSGLGKGKQVPPRTQEVPVKCGSFLCPFG